MNAQRRARERVGALTLGGVLVAILGTLSPGCSDESDKVISGPPIVSPFVSIRQELNADGTVRAEIQESVDGTQRKLFGEFRSDVLIDAAHTWILDRPTFIGEEQSDAAAPSYVGPTLTIEAGTTILCRSGLPPSDQRGDCHNLTSAQVGFFVRQISLWPKTNIFFITSFNRQPSLISL